MRSDRPSERRGRGGGGFLRDGSRQRFVILATLIAVCAFTGGSYRATMPSLAVLRPLLVLGIGVMAVLPGVWDWRGLRVPAALLAIFAATMAIQLVPLPAAWWIAMPGHDRYAGIVALATGVARPISLVPDLTINGLLALLPVVAVLVAFAGMGEGDRWNTVWIVLALGVASAALGLLQAVGSTGSLAAQSDDGVVTGFLTNRNHGAVLMAAMLPIVAVLLRHRVPGPLPRWLALGAATAILLPLTLLSGSRQGMMLGLAALVVAAAMLVQRQRGAGRRQRFAILALGVAGLALVIVVVVAVMASGRALSVDRLGALVDPSNEARFRSFPIIIRMTRDFWPFGIGYGAFDPVYRGYEPDAFLHSSYFNRAHNDLVETVMSGGLPALLLIVAFVAWIGTRGVAAIRLRRSADPAGLGKAAVAIVVLMLLASLVDYPLRTAIMASVFAIACCWLATAPVAPRTASGDAGRAAGESA